MTAPAAQDKAVRHPLNLYYAHGDVDACGPGCSEWISAEGEIDAGAANRLQRLLVQLNRAPPPIFIDSPGGNVAASMALGHLIRARQLTVSVGRTIWLGCAPDSRNGKPCDAGAQLDPVGMCNSACLFVIAGGVVRLIPPWVELGIHDLGFDPSVEDRLSPQFMEARKDGDRARLRNYIRLMGIDDQVLDEAFAIPNACIGHLSRDDAARFGLDRREFAETVWRFIDKNRPEVRKDFFVRTGSGEPHYVDGLVDLSCPRFDSPGYVLTVGRELLPSDQSALSAQPPVSIRLNDKQLSLARSENPRFYLGSTQLAPTALDDIADNATIVLPGTEFGRAEGSAGDIRLTMVGFLAAYSKLQKVCAQGTFATLPESSAQSANAPPSNPFRADLPVGKNPFLARKLSSTRSYECP